MIYIGIDLGGTNIAAGIVTEDGKVISSANARTQPERPYQDIVRDMANCALSSLKKSGHALEEVHSIGVGIPGVADQKTGRVVFCTNLGWRDTPLRAELQKYINKPVFIDNDATVAGYAESIAGVSKNCSSSVFLTLGTGVGSGIIINGKPWSGAHGVGSEIGHMTLIPDGVPCTCGNNGCVERYASATAIIRMGKQYCSAYPDCGIMKRVNNNMDRINAKTIIDSAKAGDEIALHVFDTYCNFLAMALNNITAFLDPEMIVLGGGVSHAGQFLLDHVSSKMARYLMYKSLPSPVIALAELGNEAGVIGAALLGKANK